jgi:DNA polymerase-3 subunit delta'
MSNKVIGQNKIKELFLKTLSSGKTGHCYTLVGEAGMGKSTFTSYISKMIVCERKNACGVCKSCIMAEAGTHPDIIRIVPEEDKSSIGINVMRGMVEDIYIRPYSADKKVYIINNFEKALIPAQNAVLKALEEPPEYVVFLLTVSSEKDVLETVKSRSVMLKMMPYTREEIKLALTEHISEKDAEFISGLCGGNIGKGLRLTQNESFKELRKNIFAAKSKINHLF